MHRMYVLVPDSCTMIWWTEAYQIKMKLEQIWYEVTIVRPRTIYHPTSEWQVRKAWSIQILDLGSLKSWWFCVRFVCRRSFLTLSAQETQVTLSPEVGISEEWSNRILGRQSRIVKKMLSEIRKFVSEVGCDQCCVRSFLRLFLLTLLRFATLLSFPTGQQVGLWQVRRVAHSSESADSWQSFRHPQRNSCLVLALFVRQFLIDASKFWRVTPKLVSISS